MIINTPCRLGLKGSVVVTVKDKHGNILRSAKPNTVIVDSNRILLAQLIPSSLASDIGTIPKAGRPTVSVSNTGPTNANSIAYLRLGYTTGDTVPEGASVSQTDISMVASNIVTLKIEDAAVSSDSITFTTSISVTSGIASRKYFEAALYTAGIGNESIPTSPDTSSMIMFAHQVHSLISAPEGATITYDWTITIPE